MDVQMALMEEKCIVVNEKDEITGAGSEDFFFFFFFLYLFLFLVRNQERVSSDGEHQQGIASSCFQHLFVQFEGRAFVATTQ